MTFTYLSVCSGIEAASVALEPLGWRPGGFAEIEAFPSAVLAHHYGSNMPGEPLSRNGVPNYGDFTTIPLDQLPRVDVLIGGTPCQAFSVAGKRLSLADARGNLTLSYVVLAHELARSHGLRNAWWENVPGVLNTPDNAFGCFLAALVGADAALDAPGQRWPDIGMVAGPAGRAAWRILDAEYFGLAQRRRRVFLVADFGNGADPAAVLFERQGLRGHPPARAKAGQGAAGDAAGGAGERGASGVGYGGGRTSGPIDQAATLTANGGGQAMDTAPTLPSRTSAGGGLGTDHDLDGGLIAQALLQMSIAHSLRGEGFDASEDGSGRRTPIVPVYPAPTLRAGGNQTGGDRPYGMDVDTCDSLIPVAYQTSGNCGAWETGDRIDALTTGTDPTSTVLAFSCKDHGADAASGISPTLRAMGHGDSHANAGGQVAVTYAIQERAVSENPDAGPDGIGVQADVSYTLEARQQVQAVAFDLRGREGGAQFEGPHDTANLRAASGGSSRSYVAQQWAVRRLTPVECARLQGFPDHHTRIGWRGKVPEQCPDGPQYKAYGNSMAVNVMAWIGRRLDAELRKAQP